MVGALKTYTVTNSSKKNVVVRGGYTFLPQSTTEVQVTEYKIKEISAHVDLKVEEVVEKKLKTTKIEKGDK